jgi:hypothetical protein
MRHTEEPNGIERWSGHVMCSARSLSLSHGFGPAGSDISGFGSGGISSLGCSSGFWAGVASLASVVPRAWAAVASLAWVAC